MKIILDNIIYKGYDIKYFECEIPQYKDLDEVSEQEITEYVKKELDRFLKTRD